MAITTQIKCASRPKPSSLQTYTTIFDTLLEAYLGKPDKKKRWSKADHIAAVYERNPNCWAQYVNLTCCAVWTSQGIGKTATLITPQCGIMSAHYGLSNGESVRFISSAGLVVQRTIVAAKSHYLYRGKDSGYYPDLRIVKFDEPIAETDCQPARLLPKGWGEYLPGEGNGLPCLRLDKQDHCTVGEVRSISTPSMFTCRKPLTDTRVEYYEDLVGGDSSDPCFLIGYDRPTLMTCWTYGGWGSGTSVNYDMLQKWIDATCKEYGGTIPERQALTHGSK